jgi:hypothetical protein
MFVVHFLNLALFASIALALPNKRPTKRNVQLDDWAGVAIEAPPVDSGGFVTVIGSEYFNYSSSPPSSAFILI